MLHQALRDSFDNGGRRIPAESALTWLGECPQRGRMYAPNALTGGSGKSKLCEGVGALLRIARWQIATRGLHHIRIVLLKITIVHLGQIMI